MPTLAITLRGTDEESRGAQDYQAEPNKTKLTVSFGVDFSVTEDERVHASLPKAFNL